jgi:hypothetical protein
MALDTGRYPLPSEELIHRVVGDSDGARFLEIGERSARRSCLDLGHLSRAEDLIACGPDPDAPARLGASGRFARRLVRRLTMYGEQHQRRVDQALLEAVSEKAGAPRLEPLIQASRSMASGSTGSSRTFWSRSQR